MAAALPPHKNVFNAAILMMVMVMVMVMASTTKVVVVVEGTNPPEVGTASWCVARSDASDQALQTAMDYACGSGADCTPIQPNGLCYLPNTFQAHASYAFNSYFQRKSMAPGSCDFSGTATVAKSDPSYGACVYPSSASTAGGPITPVTPPSTSTPTTTTTTNAPPTTMTPIFGGPGGLSPPGLTPGTGGTTTTVNSKASPGFPVTTLLMTIPFFISLFCW